MKWMSTTWAWRGFTYEDVVNVAVNIIYKCLQGLQLGVELSPRACEEKGTNKIDLYLQFYCM